MFSEIVKFIRGLYPKEDSINLHKPVFFGNEKQYLENCIDSTFVSYLGEYVNKFENGIAEFTGAKYAIAFINGTAALHLALRLSGVGNDCEVITQPLSFVATANAISHCGADPVFIDVEKDSLGMDPNKLDDWLKENANFKSKLNESDEGYYDKITNKRIAAIVPMHTFGFPCRIDEIVKVANKYRIPVIEDSAESLGSYFKNQHSGLFGKCGVLSFNGNKIITSGGGGMVITNDEEFAIRLRHVSTTAKIPHRWEFIHDEIGYNYRLTNICAAVGLGQLENISEILSNKLETSKLYVNFFNQLDVPMVSGITESAPNNWLNTILMPNKEEKEKLIGYCYKNGVQTRPVWRLLPKLKMYTNSRTDSMTTANWLEERLVNLPSSYRR